jgi:hypothetical protein
MKKLNFFILVLLSILAANAGFAHNPILKPALGTHDKQPINGDCNFVTIKKQLETYKDSGFAAIINAQNIIKNCFDQLIEVDKDSVYVAFSDAFYAATSVITGELELKYASALKKLDEKIDDAETKAFKKKLDACGVRYLMEEGMSYADAKADYFYNLFKGRISPVMDEFLLINSTEMKEGFTADAGLVISFEQLHKRVVIWEDFQKKHPDFFLKNDVQSSYEIYFYTFLTGIDNTPVFDYDTQKLLPEIKKLFEKIIARKDARKSSKVIANYYAYLKANDFKQPENMDKFFKDNGFSLF